MKIQINSDHNIAVDAPLSAVLESSVADTLNHLEDPITHVEVHVSDVNGNKGGNHDKRCMMEARPAGQKPVAVTDEAGTVEEAVHGAANKLKRLLDHHIGRLEHPA
jgi:ribosome-associated translation inhibitor RaiA